jgi:hypothetical protein
MSKSDRKAKRTCDRGAEWWRPDEWGDGEPTSAKTTTADARVPLAATSKFTEVEPAESGTTKVGHTHTPLK